ncbi:glutamate synthase central domain-containing protein [Escherichia coli]
MLLVLSDRDISADTLPIPAAMAVGAVQRTSGTTTRRL